VDYIPLPWRSAKPASQPGTRFLVDRMSVFPTGNTRTHSGILSALEAL